MKKSLSKLLLLASLMLIPALSQAEGITGTVSYFHTYTSTAPTMPAGTPSMSNLVMVVDGKVYTGSNLSPAVISSLDLARRTQNGVVNFGLNASGSITSSY